MSSTGFTGGVQAGYNAQYGQFVFGGVALLVGAFTIFNFLTYGTTAVVARASGASRSRIQEGVNELESGVAPVARIRRAGGGRKPAEQADPVETSTPGSNVATVVPAAPTRASNIYGGLSTSPLTPVIPSRSGTAMYHSPTR